MTQIKQSETNLKHKSLLDENSYYVRNLEIVKKEVQPLNWDCLAIYHGFEGSGKSTLMLQTAHYFDPNFNLDRVVFSPQQFNEAIEKAPPNSCIVWDEAITGAKASQHANAVNQSVISKLTQIRKKRLIFLLGFPYLYMLGKYFVSRCLFSCYVYAKDFNDRGYFNFYDFKQTNMLYWTMKERFPYYPTAATNIVFKNFSGHFSKKLPIDEKEYDLKKENARIENSPKTDIEKRREQAKRASALNITNKDIAYILGVTPATISTDLKAL